MVVEPEGVDPSTLHTSSSRSPRPKRVQAPFEEIPDTHKYAGKRTGRALRSVKPPAAARQLVGRAAVGDSGLLRILAEFLHIARPVVYCEPPGPATGFLVVFMCVRSNAAFVCALLQWQHIWCASNARGHHG